MKDQKLLPENLTAWIVILSGFVLLITFWWYPLIKTFLLGFKQAGLGFQEEPWVGFKHYKTMATSPLFAKVILNTLYLAILIVPAQIVVGLAVSTIIYETKNSKFQKFGILSFYLPFVLPIIAVGILWRFLYHPSHFGAFNSILAKLGLGPFRWLNDPKLALTSIGLMTVWKRAGYVILIYFAGLQGIPSAYYEAADIDGANALQKFFKITLPLLSSSTLFVAITTTISAFMTFEAVYIMTYAPMGARGGPVNSTKVMVFHIFNSAFTNNKMGYGSAVATVLFFMILGVTLVQFKYMRQKFEY